jgi:hypothetical protein
VSLVEDYHDRWRNLFAAMIVEKARFTPAMYDDLPIFGYREEQPDVVAVRAGAAIGVLLLSAAVLLAIGLSRFRNYPIAS